MTIPHGLPPGYTLEVDTNKIYIKVNDRYIVTKYTGIPKYVNGQDLQAFHYARTFAWSFHDGNEQEYELAILP